MRCCRFRYYCNRLRGRSVVLDSDGVAFQEEVEVIVFQNNVQIDDFIA